jgi:hypothetical protein
MTGINARIARHIEIDAETGCWLWQASLTNNGYGRVRVDKCEWKAHRYSFAVHRGPIPEGLDLDHLCRVRNCVNPDHLEPVTRAENLRRGHFPNSAKVECPQGHPYSGENLRMNSKGRRECVTCARAAGRRHYHLRKAATS